MYFDHAASDANHSKILDQTFSCIRNLYANPSVRHRSGEKVKRILDNSLQVIADYFKIKPSQIIINSGATEANNHLLKSLYEENPKGHIIISPFEHPSILMTASYLQSKGMRLSFAPIHQNGQIDLNGLVETLQPDTFLVSIVQQESEMGITQDLDEIVKRVKAKNPYTYVHSDITQGLGKSSQNLKDLDFLSFSGHKIGSMKGVGALICPEDLILKPIIHGGQSLHPSRSGTAFVEGIVSMAYAFQSLDAEKHFHHCLALNEKLRKLLKNQKNIQINSPRNAAPSILNISVLSTHQKIMQQRLQRKGIDVSTGSACSQKGGSQSVYYLYKNQRRAETSLRISLSMDHCDQDIIYLSQAIKECS